MPFIQVVEYETDRPDEVRKLGEQWMREIPAEGPTRATLAEDRDKPGHFVMVAEFPSYEQAMAHSKLPQTSKYAEKMQKLARGKPRFVNLEATQQQM